MNTTDWIGAIGVGVLLLAYVLQLLKKIESNGYAYLIINFIGAGLAGLASVLLHYWPFIILEGVWCMVSIIGIFKLAIKKT